MSLPKYIINLQELVKLLEDNRLEEDDNSSFFNKGKQKSIGMRLVAQEDKLRVSDIWYPDGEVYITGIKLGISERNSWKGNKMDVLINGELRFEDVYFKKESDYKNFRVFDKLSRGGSVEIVLKGKEGTEVWVDIDYIDELEDCTDINTPTPSPELEPEAPQIINPNDKKPPVIVYPGEMILVCEITISKNNIKDLIVEMEFSEESGRTYPDMNIVAPNEDSFGFDSDYLNFPRDISTVDSDACLLAKYNGYMRSPEVFSFKEPMEGKWSVFAQSYEGELPSLVRFGVNHPYELTYKEKSVEGWEGYTPKPFD